MDITHITIKNNILYFDLELENMAYIDFVSEQHKTTKRDYLGRVINDDKAVCAKVLVA